MTEARSMYVSLLLIFVALPPALCFSNGDLRLNGVGSSPLVGRLEIYNEGQWGTVCGGAADELSSINFNFGAAHVACRQMGLGFAVNYFSLHHQPEYRFQYGVSNSSIFLKMVNCRDDVSDNHLLQCAFFGLGESAGCDHSMDVVLQCSNITSPYNGEVRLVPDPSTPQADRTTSSGRLQLHSEGVWKDVCLDGISKSTADTFCRQMGYTGASTLPTLSSHQLEEVWHTVESPITCSASDVCLSQCLSQLPVSASVTSCRAATMICEWNNLATVEFGKRAQCEMQRKLLPESSARIIAPSSTSSMGPSLMGRLEVYVGGEWGSVCLDSFSIQEAEVVCKQLGFPYAFAASLVGSNPHFSNVAAAAAGIPIHSVSRCRGIEGHLSQCSTPKRSCASSNHSNDVAIMCTWLAPYGSVGLHGRVNGVSGSSGTLVMYTGTDNIPRFYPVCDAGFDARYAAVACRQMGYSDGIALHNSYFGSYDDTVDRVLRLTGSCTGSESQLLACPQGMGREDDAVKRRGFVPVSVNQSSECGPGQDEVSLHCVSEEIQFRLVGGASSERGYLEMNYGGTWGRICGAGFGLSEAQVACRHIGYSSVLSLRVDDNAASSSYPVHVSNLSCSGFERSMLHCHFTLEALTSSCSASQDAIWLECGAEPHPEEGQLRLVGGEEEEDAIRGRLEISFNGKWHSLCGQTFSQVAAQVACRELGFSNLTLFCTDACLGRGQNDLIVVKEMCSGTESSLNNCPKQEYHTITCDHSFDIGLECADPISTAFPTGSPVLPRISDGQLPPKQNNLLIYTVAGGGGVVLVALVLVACLCCLCCHRKRSKKDSEGRWVNTCRSDITQNGHTHLNAVGDMSTMPPIKDEGFDVSKEALDEIDISPHPLAPYDRSLTPPLPLRHHDVILHALSSSSQNSDEDQPRMNHAHRLGQATSEFYSVDGSRELAVVVVTDQRRSALDHTDRGGSPVSFASGPPPNYDDIFQSSTAVIEDPEYVNSCHANRSTGWYESVDSDSDSDMKKR